MASRRTTLGPIAINNRRTSMGGAHAASSGRTAKQRMSIAAPRVSSISDELSNNKSHIAEASTIVNTPAVGSNSRRKSFIGGLTNPTSDNRHMVTLPPTSAMRTDPRPINEKAYMSACVKKLTQYLLSSGYDQNVSTRSLARPSGTEFSHIITFLLRKIDPTFNHAGSKFEDEVAHAFKRLGYPINVSKTALAAVGSPHTWPALLSALTWLIELLKCDEATPREEDWKNPQVQPQLDIKDIEERGNDEEIVYCEDKFIECFERDTAVVAQKAEEITDWNAHLVASMEQLRNTTNELPVVERKREEYCSDLEKFSDLIKKLNDHKNSSEERVRDKTSELKTLEDELAKAEVKLDKIRVAIASQDVTVEEARRLQSEKARVEEGISKATVVKHEYSKALRGMEIELSQKAEELQAIMLQYNNKVIDIPGLSEQSESIALDIENNDVVESDQRLLLGGVDLSAIVSQHLDTLKRTLLLKTAERKQELLQFLDKENINDETMTEALDRIKILKSKKFKVEESLVRENDENDGALQVRLNEIELLERKNSSVRDPIALEIAIARYQSRCVELEALYQEEKDDFAKRREEFGAEIAISLQSCDEYMHHIISKLETLVDTLSSKRAMLDNVAAFVEN